MVRNKLSHDVSEFFIAPLVRKLWSKDESKTTNQFQARRRFSHYVNNCGQTWYCFATMIRTVGYETQHHRAAPSLLTVQKIHPIFWKNYFSRCKLFSYNWKNCESS